MAILQEYHRPRSVDEVIALLVKNAGRLTPLAGGTALVGQLETRTVTGLDGVVDLRDVGLDAISSSDNTIHVGAMCTLSTVTTYPAVANLANGLLVRAARGEGPLNLRNAATVGGVVACAEYDSEFYTALLALGATVAVRAMSGTKQTVPLNEYCTNGGLITEVSIPAHSRYGGTARIARTPSDRPIVAAHAVGYDDSSKPPSVALCGVAERPAMAGTPLAPPSDFKGSTQYRRAMSELMIQRAMDEMEKARGHAA